MANTLGVALDWSDEDIARLAAVTVDDVAAARVWWRNNARRVDRDLLDTGTTDIARCLRALNAMQNATMAIVDAAFAKLRPGSADVAAWQLTEIQVRKMNAMCGVAARRGGWDHVRVTDFE